MSIKTPITNKAAAPLTTWRRLPAKSTLMLVDANVSRRFEQEVTLLRRRVAKLRKAKVSEFTTMRAFMQRFFPKTKTISLSTVTGETKRIGGAKSGKIGPWKG